MDYENGKTWEGRIYLFDLHTNSIKQISRFTNCLWPYEVATTKDKVSYFICHSQFCKFQIFGISSFHESFEIFDLNTRQSTRGLINKSINNRFKEFYRPRSPWTASICICRLLQRQIVLFGWKYESSWCKKIEWKSMK